MEPEISLADRIDAVLPQTQCRKCGFDGCRPYASAIARGDAGINQCPPGGAKGVARLAQVTGHAALPLDPANGVEKPLALAVIDEALCIGCTLCIQACPVDAIVGAAKRMHDVIRELCTGCELCVPPCPVDCIAMVPAGFVWDDALAADSRERFESRNRRLARDGAREGDMDPTSKPITPKGHARPGAVTAGDSASRRTAIIAAAVARARARREATAAGK